MKIKEFRIQNFRSIVDSGVVKFDSNILTLVGKNESGKTCTLKALEAFDTNYEFSKNDLSEFSNLTSKYKKKEIEANNIEILYVCFKTEPDDKKQLGAINSKIKNVNEIVYYKYYDNSYDLKFDKYSFDDISNDVDKTNLNSISELLDEFTTCIPPFKEDLITSIRRLQNHNTSLPLIDKIFNQFECIKDIEENVSEHINDQFNKLKSLPIQDSDTINIVNKYLKECSQIMESIALIEKRNLFDALLDLLPKFIYFSNIDMIEDQVYVEDYINSSSDYKTLTNLLTLCDIDIENLIREENYEIITQLKSASKTITGELNNSWTQDTITVSIDLINGATGHITVSIFDDDSTIAQKPSMRSQGFRWFLSFFINFMAGSKETFENTILLLDDPGVYLHPSGQKDMLNTLKKVSVENQIIFCTHSAYLIDRNNLSDLRIVSKDKESKTSVTEKIYSSDKDTMQPIRSSLGITLSDSLFFAKETIILEGYSDELILQAFDLVCKNSINIANNDSRFTLSCNGADKIPYFAKLFLMENMKFVLVLDNDTKGRKVLKHLEDIKINKNHIITYKSISNIEGDSVRGCPHELQ